MDRRAWHLQQLPKALSICSGSKDGQTALPVRERALGYDQKVVVALERRLLRYAGELHRRLTLAMEIYASY